MFTVGIHTPIQNQYKTKHNNNKKHRYALSICIVAQHTTNQHRWSNTLKTKRTKTNARALVYTSRGGCVVLYSNHERHRRYGQC